MEAGRIFTTEYTENTEAFARGFVSVYSGCSVVPLAVFIPEIPWFFNQRNHRTHGSRGPIYWRFLFVVAVCSVVWSPSRSTIEKRQRLFLDEVPGGDKGLNELSRFGRHAVGE